MIDFKNKINDNNMIAFAKGWSKIFIVTILFSASVIAQVDVGSGSYTTTFPGTDSAGRNGYPSGTPQLSGAAVGKPVPTNDWWSTLIKSNHADNLFNYPMTMKTTNSGLVVTYIPWGVIDDIQPIVIGVQSLNETQTTVSDYSDWTVTMNWGNKFNATSGMMCCWMNGAPSRAPCSGDLMQHSHSITAQPSKPYCDSLLNTAPKSTCPSPNERKRPALSAQFA